MKTNHKSRTSEPSKKPRTWRGLAFCLAPLAIAFPAEAQNYSINWSSIDGGGGTSTSGVFAVSGTIGQPDPGTLTGGGFTLRGGFWGALEVIQTPGAPRLAVARDPVTGVITVFWPRPAEGWVLDRTPGLSTPPLSTAWTLVAPSSYQTNTTDILYYEQPVPQENRIYRLRKP